MILCPGFAVKDDKENGSSQHCDDAPEQDRLFSPSGRAFAALLPGLLPGHAAALP